MKDRWSKRKLADFFRYGSATFSMLFSLIVLFGILIYIFSVGSKRFSLRLFTADYEQTLYTVSVDSSDQRYTDPGIKTVFLIALRCLFGRWGDVRRTALHQNGLYRFRFAVYDGNE